jgi:hypothetical protein
MPSSNDRNIEMMFQAIERREAISIGWLTLKKMWLSEGCPEAHTRALRAAFFAGASHMLSLVMATVGDDEESSERDFMVLESIQSELGSFTEGLDEQEIM